MIDDPVMLNAEKGLIDKIQHFCIHDGDGIRTVVFLKGCGYRCPWCSNPESLTPDIVIGYRASKCSNCGLCARECPKGAVPEEGVRTADRSLCTLCGACVRICPNEARTLFGKYMTPEEVYGEVEKDRAFYRKSGGGVTFSGGECTLQAGFLRKALKLCRAGGIDTAIETSGSADASLYLKIAPDVDTFLIDVKHMDSAAHERYTGFPNEKPLDNIRLIATRLGKRVMLRFPLIPGVNDSLENITETALFAVEIMERGNLVSFNVLPYHKMGAHKYAMLGMRYEMEGTEPPSPERIEQVVDFFRGYGLPAVQGG